MEYGIIIQGIVTGDLFVQARNRETDRQRTGGRGRTREECRGIVKLKRCRETETIRKRGTEEQNGGKRPLKIL